MQASTEKLVRGARKGDILLLHYSGHGANVPDDDGEADRRDEILCPTDLDWKKPLRDDWLRTTFDRLRTKRVSLTVIMDCCHSGTNRHLLLPPDAKVISRYLANPWDIMAVESGRALRGKVVGELRRSSHARRKRSDVVDADIPELLITGCRDTQTSADAYIGRSYSRHGHVRSGIFRWCASGTIALHEETSQCATISPHCRRVSGTTGMRP